MRPTLVRVSDYCELDSWYDSKSGLWFNKKDKSITIPENVDIVNINRYINQNVLINLTDSSDIIAISDYKNQVTATIMQTPNQLIEQAYNDIEVTEEDDEDETPQEEVPTETVVEEIVEEVITEPTKVPTTSKKRKR